MLNVEVEGMEAIGKAIDSMVQQIDTLGKQDMFKELLAWQVEDMHRKYPNTSQDDDKTVSTEVWPRSRLPERRKNRVYKPRPRRVFAAPRGGPPAHSTRPILREVLFAALCDRMAALMSRALSWVVRA